MNGRYILDDDGNPVPEPDLIKWGTWIGSSKHCILAYDTNGTVRVSTVFLGLDHNFEDKGRPVLWETMIFGFDEDHDLHHYQERYTSRGKALEGHKRAKQLAGI